MSFTTIHRQLPPCPTLHPSFYPLRLLNPHFVQHILADLAADASATRVIDGELFISKSLLAAFTAGDDEWLYGPSFKANCISEITLDDL